MGVRQHKSRILSFAIPVSCIVFFMIFIVFLEVSVAFIIFLKSSAKSVILHSDVRVRHCLMAKNGDFGVVKKLQSLSMM